MTAARSATDSPLVERCADGSLAPTGRQFSGITRGDGRNCYGLDDAETVAFGLAVLPLNGARLVTPATMLTRAEATAMNDAGLTSETPNEQKDAWVAEYRKTRPLPTSFSPLPPDDPCLFVEEAGSAKTEQAPAPAPPPAADPVISVLLPDGWHDIAPGSFQDNDPTRVSLWTDGVSFIERATPFGPRVFARASSILAVRKAIPT